jgi:tungstate transport system permease protein
MGMLIIFGISRQNHVPVAFMGDISSGFMQAIDLIVTLNPDVTRIAILSVYISLSATILAACVSLPLAGGIHFYEFRGKQVLITLIQTLYSVPTVVVGLLIYLMISRSGPLGIFGLLFTPEGMILGQTVLIIPIMMGLIIAALGNTDTILRDTLVSLGATSPQAILEIIREARYAILSAIILGFGRAISEVGVAMMIGGNIRGETRVLTTAIALQTGMGDFGFSIALGLILLAIALVVVIILNLVTSGAFSDFGRVLGGSPRT